MSSQLAYVIKYVSDMEAAVGFHRDVLGLNLRFSTPDWTEFATGTTTLALHSASDVNPAGGCRIGIRMSDLADLQGSGATVRFVEEARENHGMLIAAVSDTDDAPVSVSQVTREA